MLFSKNTQGYFVEVNDYAILIASTSDKKGPMTIQALKTCSLGDAAQLSSALRELQPKRSSGSAYVHATCGIYPEKRVVRRCTMDPKRYKEENYVNEVISTQFRVDGDKYSLWVLNAADGSDFDLSSQTHKEALFVGFPNEDIADSHKQLLAKGIYPEVLELGSVATLGGLIDYLAFSESKTPTLVLEVGGDSTQSFIISNSGVDASRPIPQGLNAMLPVVQKELGLKDEESARKLFYSNTFDFTGLGPTLIKKLLKELQSSIGFYEVQTGQSIGQVICTLLPAKMGWLGAAISSQLGVGLLKLNMVPWLKKRGVAFGPGVAVADVDERWLGLFSLMITHKHADVQKTS